MDMVRRYFSMAKARELQETAETTEQAVRYLKNSCGMCSRAAFCSEDMCPVMKAHRTRMVYLEAKEREANQPKRPIVYQVTRSYNISPLNQKVRSCLQMMAAARKHSSDYSTDEYVHVTTYEALLKRRDYPILKAMMVHNGHYRRGRQKVTAITPIVNKLKEIIKEVF